MKEAQFARVLNNDLMSEPNLLQTVNVQKYDVSRIAFYLPGQIAYGSFDDSIGILSAMNDRIFYTDVYRQKIEKLAVLADDVILLDAHGNAQITSFSKKTISELIGADAPICSIATNRRDKIAAGTNTGSLFIWDFQSQKILKLRQSEKPIIALAMYQNDMVLATDGQITKTWKIAEKNVKVFEEKNCTVTVLAFASKNEIILGLIDRTDDVSYLKLINLDLDLFYFFGRN